MYTRLIDSFTNTFAYSRTEKNEAYKAANYRVDPRL